MVRKPRPTRHANSGVDPDRQLIEGEGLALLSTNEKPMISDEELNSRYAKGDIRIVTESARYPLTGILTMLKERAPQEGGGKPDELRYKLDPEYQRRHRWSIERKSKLIESFLMNVPVPPVFLYERDLARFEVMDGRQRLTALSEFFEDKFKLTGLQYWSDLDGRTYSKLPSKVRDGIDRRYISSIILLKETAATPEQEALLKKMVFERLNSGGVRVYGQSFSISRRFMRAAAKQAKARKLVSVLSRRRLMRRKSLSLLNEFSTMCRVR